MENVKTGFFPFNFCSVQVSQSPRRLIFLIKSTNCLYGLEYKFKIIERIIRVDSRQIIDNCMHVPFHSISKRDIETFPFQLHFNLINACSASFILLSVLLCGKLVKQNNDHWQSYGLQTETIHSKISIIYDSLNCNQSVHTFIHCRFLISFVGKLMASSV